MDTPWTHTTVVGHSVTPHSEMVKDLPRPPSVLQPLRKHETTGQSAQPPRRRRRDLPPQRLRWWIVLPGFGVALLSASMASVLLLYLALRQDGDPFRHGFYVDEIVGGEAHLYGLVMSTVFTNVVWHLCFPVVLSMAAYCIAWLWLSHQQHPRDEGPNLLTPLQYGLLFKLLSVPGPVPFLQAGAYLTNRRTRVPAPSFLTTSVVLIGGVLGVTYLISAADIWLHATSAVVILPSPALSHLSLPAPPISRGHYPFAPVVMYLTLLYLHSFIGFFLTTWAASLRSPVLRSAPPDPDDLPPYAAAIAISTAQYPPPPAPTALRLAYLHLTDPLAPIASRLSTRTAPLGLGLGLDTGYGHGQALFVEDLNTARVEVGVWAREGGRRRWGDTTGDRVFGVYRKVVPFKGEIY
ncbi:hypothetical protein FB45DRAFT_923437 [Roridomyces roridus]|uniref:Uncharacterized protein n=1 Tax=Roridomyces roridus TaxID=1738132 RepID=A0AAD7BL26_9AGAR|nr:hypothetical protein FB45DRAFT_923437 [Roridomyces roridus]